MSRTTQYFIEFKQSNTKHWTAFAPAIYVFDNKYNHTVEEFCSSETLNTLPCTRAITDSIQGYVRDILDGDNNFNHRGFPEDMTCMIANYIEFVQEKYKEDIGWGKSYANLQELYDFAITKKTAYEECLKNYENMKSHDDIMDELHYLENLIINKDEESKQPEKEEAGDSEYGEIIEDYRELIKETESFITFIVSINRMVNFVYSYWYDLSDIRLIFYTN